MIPTTRRSLLGAGAVLAAAPAPGPDRPIAPASPAALAREARAMLPRAVADWVAGGAAGGAGLRRNRAALEAATLTPRLLTGAGLPDLSVTLFGQPLALPVFVCPFGLQGLLHPEGEIAMARGAAAAGALVILPMVATHSLEETAAATPGAARWFQIYPPEDRGVLLDLAQRAEAAGCSALVLTLDAPVAAVRERDLANAFAPPLALGAGNDRLGYGRPLMGITNPAFGREDLAWLAARTRLPLVLKGVLHPEDAMAEGAAGVIVSSHGGRQVGSAPASFSVLPRVAQAVGRQRLVVMDSGIRRGEDVVKAMAAGAAAVGIGRPAAWALALGGAAGVRSLLERLGAEVTATLRMLGAERPDPAMLG